MTLEYGEKSTESGSYELPITHVERRFNSFPRDQYINLADLQMAESEAKVQTQ